MENNGTFSFFYIFYNYGRFHNNKVNQLIHLVCIPLILFTLFILGAIHWHQYSFGFLEDIVPGGTVCIETSILLIATLLMYLTSETTTGICAALWMIPAFVVAQHMAAANGDASAPEANSEIFRLSAIARTVHSIAWVAQFYGHGVHEGRAPALATNLFFASFAPFFVTFEFMNYVFGYKESTDEMKEVRSAIDRDIQEFRATNAAKKTK